ncbi:hypothetical protein SKAU_G00228390 [Synaphobranchus kaupii]|uniref:Uncharacterized protein n=1 Tax=Synaphobranchus kaupii TaxID=118154 RepID=A0A9Q1F553_SYNKA|nr:hypothetical protein SKAU_G00228390 [Synaphobranchus kaupii]
MRLRERTLAFLENLQHVAPFRSRPDEGLFPLTPSLCLRLNRAHVLSCCGRDYEPHKSDRGYHSCGLNGAQCGIG